TRNLAAALPPDLAFFLLFGSSTAATGGLGQADTAAAAAFLAAYAQNAARAGAPWPPVQAIGWGLFAWQTVTAPSPHLARELAADLPLTSLLEAPTAAALARRVEALTPRPAAPGPAEVERLLAEIESLSATEAEARLARALG